MKDKTPARKRILERRIDTIRKERTDAVGQLRTTAQNILYWQTIMVMVIGNIFIAVVLVPILLMVKGWFAAAIVALLGFLFGLIFNHLIHDIEDLKQHHHLFAGIFIPAVAIADLYIITSVTKSLGPALGLAGDQNTFVLSLAFIGTFLLPYVVSHLLLRKK